MLERILVVFPHPDDEAFGTSGFLIKQIQMGSKVTYACATLGEMGRNMGNPFFANRETLPQIRKQELMDACKVIGISDVRLLGMRDKTLEFENRSELADVIESIVKEINPTIVITFYPGHGVHPDHDACGEATIEAISRIPMNERPTVYCKAITRNRVEVLGESDISIDVTDVLDKKIDSIRAHKSQTEGLISQIQDKMHQNHHEVMDWLLKETFYIYKW
ncbi:bacillithiol biosynthesis deacetylase BshB2 [Bacillus timonensis]|nr:bacillithiol biosynthesis deacetylase BshB2 [Bacillus timonensis]